MNTSWTAKQRVKIVNPKIESRMRKSEQLLVYRINKYRSEKDLELLQINDIGIKELKEISLSSFKNRSLDLTKIKPKFDRLLENYLITFNFYFVDIKVKKPSSSKDLID